MRQLLPHDVTAEDRAAGCIWASTFRRAGDEVQKLGTITGTPTINHGITLNGTTDCVQYDLWGQFLGNATISFHCLFWPDTDYDEDVTRYLFSTPAGTQYSAAKLNNAGNNVIQIYMGNTALTSIAQATYQALWNVGGRNLLSFWGTTGNNNAAFNGTQIMTTEATAWTAANPTSIEVGAIGGASFFDGMIEELKIYREAQTLLDHNAIWAGGGV